jgi:hypothetical protein
MTLHILLEACLQGFEKLLTLLLRDSGGGHSLVLNDNDKSAAEEAVMQL